MGGVGWGGDCLLTCVLTGWLGGVDGEERESVLPCVLTSELPDLYRLCSLSRDRTIPLLSYLILF